MQRDGDRPEARAAGDAPPVAGADGGGRDCPLCNGASVRRFARHGHWIRDCTSCGHRFAEAAVGDDHVARVYGDAYFEGGGAGYARYLDEERILRDHGRRYARLVARHTRPGRVLDVGAAAGFWLAGFLEGGWTGRGVEPNATMAAHARERLGLDVETGTLERLPPGEPFDLVSMIQVVAHFPDVRRAFRAAAARTRPGGHWLVETWDRESWTARLLGRRWHEYNPPSVLHWFSADGLARLAAEFSLREVARGRPRKRIRGAHAKSLLRHELGRSPLGRLLGGALGVIPDGLALPYPTDDLFWMLLRRSDAAEN